MARESLRGSGIALAAVANFPAGSADVDAAAKVFAAAGANVVICANGAEALKKVAAECEKLGGKAEVVAKRPSSEQNCDAIVEAAVKRFGGVDIVAVGSGQNKVSKIVDQKPEDFLDVMDANVTQSWLMARSAARQMIKQGRGGKKGGQGSEAWVHEIIQRERACSRSRLALITERSATSAERRGGEIPCR